MMKLHTLTGYAWIGGPDVTPVRVHIHDQRIARIERGLFKDSGDGILALSDEQVLLPGFHDAHLHLLTGGLQMSHVDCSGTHAVDDVLARISDFIARANPEPGAWIQGYGLEQTAVDITRVDLDRAAPAHSVFIWTHDLHSAIVNSRALVAARVDGSIRNPEGGAFERGADGKLNGVLREHAAYYVRRHIPEPTSAECRAAFHRAQTHAFAHGITAASASVRPDLLPHYLELADSRGSRMRLNIWKVSGEFDFGQDRFEKRSEPHFRFACLKGFTDGALGSRTASFWQPYTDDQTTSGTLLVREGPLARFVRAAHRDNYQIAMHAIGDRANSVVLDALEMASCDGVGPELRPRIEHCQHLRERDIPRFAQLGVVASMQPIHCTADMDYVARRIGTEREKGSYAWRSLLKSGAVLAFGSDWPIESLSPFAGLHAAVTRTKRDGSPEGGWNSQECLTVEQALLAYTQGAAYAAGWEGSSGKIAEGLCADFCVVNRNPFAIDSRDLHQLCADFTIVNGEVVFSRSASSTQ
ncbi:MAG: amidohydrolase family protein [bacterium]|nr:amidohydrolase family protein [bacterium]